MFMAQNFCYLIAVVLFALIACNPPTSRPPQPQPVATGPSTHDLLDALQGRWRNEQDTTYLIEVTDDLMTHYHGGQEPEGFPIEVYNDCPAAMCGVDSLTASNGWCFIEKKPADDQCIQVMTCDTATLRFRMLGGSDQVYSFKKI